MFNRCSGRLKLPLGERGGGEGDHKAFPSLAEQSVGSSLGLQQPVTGIAIFRDDKCFDTSEKEDHWYAKNSTGAKTVSAVTFNLRICQRIFCFKLI